MPDQGTKDAAQDGVLVNITKRLVALEEALGKLRVDSAEECNEIRQKTADVFSDFNDDLSKLATTIDNVRKAKGAKGSAELSRKVDALWDHKSFSA